MRCTLPWNPLLSADPSTLRRREAEIDDSDDSNAARQEAEEGQGEELEEPEEPADWGRGAAIGNQEVKSGQRTILIPACIR